MKFLGWKLGFSMLSTKGLDTKERKQEWVFHFLELKTIVSSSPRSALHSLIFQGSVLKFTVSWCAWQCRYLCFIILPVNSLLFFFSMLKCRIIHLNFLTSLPILIYFIFFFSLIIHSCLFVLNLSLPESFKLLPWGKCFIPVVSTSSPLSSH